MGQKLIRIQQGPQELAIFDYISLVDDRSRMGNLRFFSNGELLAEHTSLLPTENDVLSIAGKAQNLTHLSEEDISHIAFAGSSLGGARPKINIIDSLSG
ncbi:hypothetical protein [Arcanobacterium phocae]|uniref:hypothetical protein n=1 Tax=Arcanobacterium phocae TaxID=131112 RepID=UPI001C0F033F|nr:hypothetical protein [Arcanobacterium phocae]